MRISYAITVCNELVEIQRLLPFLIENKSKEEVLKCLYTAITRSSDSLELLV